MIMGMGVEKDVQFSISFSVNSFVALVQGGGVTSTILITFSQIV
jgi:hypothetical protein